MADKIKIPTSEDVYAELEVWAESESGREAIRKGWQALVAAIGDQNAVQYCLWISDGDYTLARRGWSAEIIEDVLPRIKSPDLG